MKDDLYEYYLAIDDVFVSDFLTFIFYCDVLGSNFPIIVLKKFFFGLTLLPNLEKNVVLKLVFSSL